MQKYRSELHMHSSSAETVLLAGVVGVGSGLAGTAFHSLEQLVSFSSFSTSAPP